MIKDCTLVDAFTCKQEENVVEVAKLLRDKKVRHLHVVDEDGKPLGVISVTDMNNRVVAENKDPTTTLAKDVMTSPIDVLGEEDEVKKAFEQMGQKGTYSCIIVNAEGKLTGVLTFNEAYRHLVQKHELM